MVAIHKHTREMKRMEKSDIRIDFLNFVEPPDESISYPSGILFLSANLKNHNYTNICFLETVCILRKFTDIKNKPSNVFSWPREWFEQRKRENNIKIIEYLDRRNPHLLFLGPITTYHLVELVSLISRIRERYKETAFFVGGPHFGKDLFLDKQLLDVCQGLDGIIVGEAEETIVEIADLFTLKIIDDKGAFSRSDFRSKMGTIPGVLTRINTLVEREPPNIKDLPLPDIDLLDEYWNSENVTTQYNYSLSDRRNPIILTDRGYFQGEADWGYFENDIRRFGSFRSQLTPFPHGSIVGSRGCPFNCSFCASSGDRRLHPAQYVFDIISLMNKRYHIEHFAFFESLFTTAAPIEQKRVLELCDLLIESDLNIEYLIEIRADVITSLPDDVLASMIQSGCVEYNLGLEKGSDRALKKVRKDISIRQHFEAVKKIRRIAEDVGREIIVNGTFIFGGPEEKKEDIMDSVFHSWRLHLDGVTFYTMNIFPGTHIYREAIREGVIEPQLSTFLDVNFFPKYITDEVPLQYLNDIISINNEARYYLREFRNKIREMELEFLPREARILRNVSYDMTRVLIQSFYDFVNSALEFAKRSEDLLYVDGSVIPLLLEYVQNVENEINLIEEKLKEKYSDYDSDVQDYVLGSVSDSMWSFISKFSELIDKKNYQYYSGVV